MSTAKKMLFTLDEKVKKELETLIPQGQRSKVINEALMKELLLLKRRKIAAELLEIAGGTRPISAKEIIGELKKDRRRH